MPKTSVSCQYPCRDMPIVLGGCRRRNLADRRSSPRGRRPPGRASRWLWRTRGQSRTLHAGRQITELAATGSLFRLVHAGPRRVAAPGRPPGELGVLRVDADQAAVFGANIDPAALDYRLRAYRAADRPALRDLAGLGVQAPDLACRSANEDRVARGRRRGHQRAAELGHVAVDLALPAGFAGLVVGAHDLVAHRRDQVLLERQHARPLVRLHARDAPLADIDLRRGGVGGDRSAAAEPVHRVERFGLLGVGGLLLDFLVEILRFLFLELALGLPL